MKEVHVARGRVQQYAAGEKAQITLLLGEGSDRRSVTRHALRYGSGWMGYNPDESAAGMRMMAQAVANDALEQFNTVREKVKNLPGSVDEEERRKLEKRLQRVGETLREAKVQLERTLEQYPEKVLFIYE